MPFYWLGAFFNPRGLLALIKQESIRNFAGDRSGYFEQFVFQTEVTARDKDHVSGTSYLAIHSLALIVLLYTSIHILFCCRH